MIEPHEILDRCKQYLDELYEANNHPNILPIEEETIVDDDYKGFSILRDEFNLALKEIRNRKAVGVDEIRIELIKNMEEDGKKKL